MDGTLTQPGAIDFARMRSRLAAPAGVDVLDHVAAAPSREERDARARIVAEEEMLGIERQRLMPDLSAIVAFTSSRPALRVGLLTRNNAAAAAHTMGLLRAAGATFHRALSREWDGGPPKPDPAALLSMADAWAVSTAEMVMVGDSIDDIACGRAAGATSILIGDGDEPAARALAHFTVPSLAALAELLASEFAH
jgi:HAD superfamily hydrolase (TIGR01549 family)